MGSVPDALFDQMYHKILWNPVELYNAIKKAKAAYYVGLTRRITTTQENRDFCKRNYTTMSFNLNFSAKSPII